MGSNVATTKPNVTMNAQNDATTMKLTLVYENKGGAYYRRTQLPSCNSL
jgi:hypothetical protein